MAKKEKKGTVKAAPAPVEKKGPTMEETNAKLVAEIVAKHLPKGTKGAEKLEAAFTELLVGGVRAQQAHTLRSVNTKIAQFVQTIQEQAKDGTKLALAGFESSPAAVMGFKAAYTNLAKNIIEIFLVEPKPKK